jgi:cytochrome b5
MAPKKLKTYSVEDLAKYKGSEAESHEGKIVFAIKHIESKHGAFPDYEDGKYYVYDVTDYSIDHPGGDEIMRDNSGTDATGEFEEIGHSATAKEQLADLRVGVMNAAAEEEFANSSSSSSSGGAGSSPVAILGGLLVVGVAAFLFLN